MYYYHLLCTEFSIKIEKHAHKNTYTHTRLKKYKLNRLLNDTNGYR